MSRDGWDGQFLRDYAARRTRWGTSKPQGEDVDTEKCILVERPVPPPSDPNDRKKKYWQLPVWCANNNLPIPTREYQFHPGRKWPFDFAWPFLKLALEIDGGLFVDGAHVRGARILKTHEKLSEAAALGWRVIYCTPEDLESLGFQRVQRAIREIEKERLARHV